MLHRDLGGFTLIELMVTVGILSILLMLAGPSLRELVMNARMTGQANDLMGDLNIARSEAIKRNLRTYLCTSTNGATCTNSAWAQGWLVFVDVDGDGRQDAAEVALKSHGALETTNTMVVAQDSAGLPTSRFVPYRPSGVSAPGAQPVTFRMCDSRTGALGINKGRLITISATGRPIVTRINC